MSLPVDSCACRRHSYRQLQLASDEQDGAWRGDGTYLCSDKEIADILNRTVYRLFGSRRHAEFSEEKKLLVLRRTLYLGRGLADVVRGVSGCKDLLEFFHQCGFILRVDLRLKTG